MFTPGFPLQTQLRGMNIRLSMVVPPGFACGCNDVVHHHLSIHYGFLAFAKVGHSIHLGIYMTILGAVLEYWLWTAESRKDIREREKRSAVVGTWKLLPGWM